MEIFICIVLVLTLLLIVDYMWKPKHGHILPYRIPIIGHLLLFKGTEYHKTMAYWAERLNNETFTFQIFNLNIVVLNSDEAITEGLVRKGKELGGRFSNFRNIYLTDGKDIITPNIGPIWRKRRNFAHLQIRQYGEGMRHIERLVSSISQNLVDRIKTECSTSSGFDSMHDIYLSITNSISTLITGQKYSADDIRFHNWVKMVQLAEKSSGSIQSGWELDLFPWLRYFGNSSFQDLVEAKRIGKELIAELKHNYFTVGVNEDERGMIHAMFDEANETNDPDFMNDEVITATLTTIMTAGILTSSMSLQAFLYIMAVYPDVQEEFKSEIFRTIQTNGNDYIGLNDRDNMPYACACLLELQRFLSLVPFAIPHLAMTDTHVTGTQIKQGSIIIANLWQLHHNESYWPDSWIYNPKRFLDDNNNLVPCDHVNRKRMMAFGAGPRVCFGQPLAKARLFIFMTKLIQEFEVKPVNDLPNQELHDPRNYQFNIILKPKNQPLQFVARK